MTRSQPPACRLAIWLARHPKDGKWGPVRSGAGVLLIAAILLLPACGPARIASGSPASRHVSLVLDWYPNADHGGLYTAISRGYFARRRLVLQPRVPSDTTAQIKLVAAGSADFGISYETDLLQAFARGLPVRSVLCIMQHPLDAIMTLRSSGIIRPRQLEGKRIGMAGSPSDEPLVAATMRSDGASITRATMVNVGYNLLPALLTHRVDAVIGVYWTWEAIQAQLKGYPVNVMRLERWGVPNYCELVLVTSTRTIHERPRLVANVVHALQLGYKYAELHPAAASAALHDADKTLNRPLVLDSLRLLRQAVASPRTIGYQDPSQWRIYARWLTAHRLIPTQVKASSAFTDRFLQPHVRL